MGPRRPGSASDRLLKRVSRSFYLTLRLLPAEVRPTLSLAYLLARASDTIADSCTAPVRMRIDLLRGLPESCPAAPLPVAGAEGELLAVLPGLLDGWKASVDSREIEAVWRKILAGQIFDLERFGAKGAPPLTPEELDRYTYLVAGCVGEFWTDLCFRHIGNFSSAAPEKMRLLGKRFGQGLQLVNILGDRRADAAIGRVYVPPERFGAEMEAARQRLAAGGAYVSAIRPRRLRAACFLPLQLGRDTLDLIEKNPGSERVKVSRCRVWTVCLRALLQTDRDPDVRGKLVSR